MPLLLILGATALAHSAFNGSRLILSLQALSFGASPLAVGVIMSLFAALPMLFGIRAGRFVDRVGVRGPLLAATGTLPFFVFLPAVLPVLPAFYVAGAGLGGAFTLFHICVQHAVGEGSSPDDRRANFGWLALGFAISNFLGPTTAGVAIDLVGHRLAYCLSGLFALAGFGLLYARRDRFSHTPDAPPPAAQRNALDLLRNPALRRVFIVTGLLASAWDLFVFAMPIYGTRIGLSASTIGFILGSFAVATFVIRLALPWLSRVVPDWTMITATMVVAGVAYAIFPLVVTVPLLAATAFLLGLGLGSTQPSVMSLLYATAPAGRAAEAVGIRSMVLNTSTTVLPIAFGALGAALGMAPVFLSMAGALAAGGVYANRFRRGRPGP